MKLLTKTGLNFVSASVFFFLFGSLGGYYFIRYAVNNFLNNELLDARQLVDQMPLEDLQQSKLTYADIRISIADEDSRLMEPTFSDTVMYNTSTNNYEFFRKLSYSKSDGVTHYKLSILRPSTPSDLLVMKFTLMLTVFPILFFLILYMVNRQTTKSSLSVFYDTIKKLKTFDVNKDNRLDLMTSDVDEFEQLNEVFNTMETKIKQDYERLKEYTENTSHELQTPLAIITSKLDELIQSSNLTEEQIKLIAGLMETTSRLSKINQALIFLAKLDNRIFSNEEDVDFMEVIREQIDLLQPLIEDKNITINIESSDSIIVKMNRSLAHTLIQNLLKNAIRHNIPDGYINISYSNHQLEIHNSGKALDVHPDELFHRFRKNSSHPQSLGIGLSVVKRICDISDITINYLHNGDDHRFILTLKQEKR